MSGNKLEAIFKSESLKNAEAEAEVELGVWEIEEEPKPKPSPKAKVTIRIPERVPLEKTVDIINVVNTLMEIPMEELEKMDRIPAAIPNPNPNPNPNPVPKVSMISPGETISVEDVEDKFELRARMMLLTYRTHLNKSEYIEWVEKKFKTQGVNFIRLAHETGDEECVYEHTHVVLE